MPRKPDRPAPEPAAPAPAEPAPPAHAPAAPDPADPSVQATPEAAPRQPSAQESLLEHGQPMLEPLTAYELAPQVLLAPDGGGDRAFAADLDPTVRDFGSTRSIARVCEWCNTPLPDADAATCPHCGANLKPMEPDAEIPGLTTMTLEAELARRRAEAQQQATSNAGGGILRSAGSILGGGRPAAPAPAVVTPQSLQLDDQAVEEAIRPPDDAVRRAMLQLEIEALQAQAPGVAAGGLDPAAVAAEVHHDPAAEAAVDAPAASTSAPAEGPTASPPPGA
ncbi:MAG TPA: zinc ribbon domain-containing protein [Candidatus Sulfotelmatobacter sp.]|nr:zinc ribbon domain-containing protein [Candidatus Sulfotelmatobacter sp.]